MRAMHERTAVSHSHSHCFGKAQVRETSLLAPGDTAAQAGQHAARAEANIKTHI